MTAVVVTPRAAECPRCGRPVPDEATCHVEASLRSGMRCVAVHLELFELPSGRLVSRSQVLEEDQP